MNSLNHDPPHAHIAPNTRCLNNPPRPRLSKERGHLLDGAATPPWPRRGAAAFPDARQKRPNSRPLLREEGSVLREKFCQKNKVLFSSQFSDGTLPSSRRRGGCATKKMLRSLRSGADGVVVLKPCLKRIPKTPL